MLLNMMLNKLDESDHIPERTLTLVIRLTSEDTFAIDIYDHSSGDDVTIACHDEGSCVEGENKLLAAEIRSWVSLMRDGI